MNEPVQKEFDFYRDTDVDIRSKPMANVVNPEIDLSLRYLAKAANQIAEEHGFWGDDEPYNGIPQDLVKSQKIALMHSELSEALEGVRKPKQDDHCPEFTSEVVEMADVVIRLVDYCYHYNLPLVEAIQAKMLYNHGRPYKHGKAF